MLILKIFKKKPKYISISDYLDKTGVIRKDFASKFSITEAHLSMLINKKRKPGNELAIEIHNKTGIPLENLIQ